MLKQLSKLGAAIVAAVLMAVPATAAPIVDFTTGSAGTGGTIQWVGANLIGRNIPIGGMTVDGAPMNNGDYLVTGTLPGAGGGMYARLDFDTSAGFSITRGCIEALDVGISVGGACTYPVWLLDGSFFGWNPNGANGLVDAWGVASLPGNLLEGLGLRASFSGNFAGFSIAADPLTQNGPAAQVTNTRLTTTIAPVPEPATLVLLGTGLLAAFRTGRYRNAGRALDQRHRG